MQRCYRCHLRMVYSDEGDRLCLACGRDQDVRPVVVTAAPGCERPAGQRACRWCTAWFAPRTAKQQHCSAACSERSRMQARRQTPWPVLGTGVCPQCGATFARRHQHKVCCTKRCANRYAYRKRRAFQVA